MENSDLLQSMENAYEAFMVPLRMGDGFKPDPFKEFCKLLAICSDEWEQKESIPKRAALIFVDAFSAMTSASYLYDEAKREEIDIAADKLANLIRQCVK
jgi:hypothetical protein